jgi:hypothetical protein
MNRNGKTESAIVARAAIAALLAATAWCGAAQANDETTMVAALRGGQEVPPVATSAFGSGRFIIDTNANTVTYHISFTGLSAAETGAHIHGPADPGVNAGVVHDLGTGNPKVGVWNYPPAMEEDILAGRMYVNIHSTTYPGGEIRGQINHFAMDMDGFQENPAVPTSGSGWGTFNIDTCSQQLHYYIVVESLDYPETAAHIHGLALPGTNAGVVHPLPAGSPKVGTWDYPPAMEEAILNGLTYVNVHSSQFPGGEIRGQIVSTIVPIDGAQEVPPVSTPASGNGYIALDKSTHTMGYIIRYANLTTAENAAHIHGYAPAGVNAGVVHPLPPGQPKKGTWTYGAPNAANVLGGLTYINIHTAMFPGGEIRGQIIPAQKLICKADCPWDLNGDSNVDVLDLLDLLDAWGPNPGHPADFNGDDTVDVLDLLELLDNWGPCPTTAN